MIPKIIHYCWLSNDPVPENMQCYMETWKKFFPDYEIMKWDFNRFDEKSSVWVSEAFKNKKYAFAADYIRLFALYNYGGIYLDMDVQVLKSFDPLLNLNTMICYENRGIDEINQTIEAGTMGAEKGQPWIKDCLDYYKNRHFVKSDGTFDMIPIPNIIMKLLQERYNVVNVTTIEDAENLDNDIVPIFPYVFFSPKDYGSLEINKTEETYSIHHFNGTWKNPFWIQFRQFLVSEFHVSGHLSLRITRWLNGETIKKYWTVLVKGRNPYL